jgi:hypothetical protein
VAGGLRGRHGDGGALFGARWFERADPFELYSTLVGHLSVWGRRPDGTLVFRNPLANLDRIPAAPGLVAVIAVLLGSTAFDSFRESNSWLRYTQATEAKVPLVNIRLLLGTCALVGLTFTAATMATGADTDVPRPVVPRLFAHSLVPIIVGYMVAHYLTFFVETGQQTLIQASDPLSNGSNLFGTGDWEVNCSTRSPGSTCCSGSDRRRDPGPSAGVGETLDSRILRPPPVRPGAPRGQGT